MAKSVLELAVGTGQWDAGLRKAKSALDNFTQSQGGLQQALDKESQKMQKFVQMIGGMESTAKTAKGQMNDYKSTIEQLTMQYNRMTEAQKNAIGQDYLQAIEQMKQKYQSVNKEIQEMNRSLNNVKMPDLGEGGGGLFAGLGGKMSGALQVFGGNLMTKGAGMLAGLASEMGDMVKQGVELAKQGEGIRIAFERLGRGDILDGLRQATHGTVTDIELMKAAVKFNDFKLPLDELGTMLAFAQQKAKDTGQSVDYMVDSIVTGLGRKSLMILDNLGLSAAEIKEKMAETGDMTKAVGAIIREQMAKAGDYVETAADRAAQANVSLQNKMEELGRKFAPLQEASNNFWTSMKIGILDVIGGPLTHLLNKLTQAGRLMNAYGQMGGNAKVGRMTANLAGTSEGNRQNIYAQQQAEFWRYINKREQYIKDIESWQRGNRSEQLSKRVGAIQEQYGILDTTKIRAEVDAAKKMLADYQAAAKQILQPIQANIDTSGADQSITSLTKKLKDLQEQRKKAIAAGDTELSKNLAKQISQVKSDIKGLNPTALSTTHKATPQETAANKVKDAERIYTETLLKNSIRLEAGLDSTLDNKKKELSAQERLFDAYNDAYATYKDPAYKEASKQAAEKIKQLAEEVKSLTDTQEASKKAARELESAQKKLADAQQKLADAQATGSATAVYKAQKDVDRQQDVVNRLQNPSLPVPAKPTGFEAYKQSVQAEIKFDQMQVDENTLHSLLHTALNNGLEGLTVDYGGLQQKIAQGIDIPDSTWEALQEEINAKLKELGVEPIAINFNTGGLEEAGKDAKSATKDFQQAASAIGSVGSALSSIEDPGAKVAGIVAQAIATVASAFAGALHTDGTTKSNIWAFLAAAAASTATMVSTIASIHSATGYAQGGQIKGNSYSGDNILGMVDGGAGGIVGLNAGEIVLNQAQTANVANALEGSGMRGIELSASVSGEQILLVANRTTRRQGYGELATFK
jgi:hypothetical protein